MRIRLFVALAATLGLAPLVVNAAPEPKLLVVASPGSPGSTEDAQPRIDAFAKALSDRAGTAITAVYDPSDSSGAKRIEGAGIAIVSLPFFLEHEKQLGLHARLQVMQKGRPALERWTLVAQKGRIKNAAALGGITIVSNAAFAPGFVRGALSAFGDLPESVKLVQSTAVLSSLRRAAAGEPVAVLLDGTQEASLASLAFASKLEVVTRSPAMPAALVVTIDARMPAKTWSGIQRGLLELAADRKGAAVLDAIQLAGFAPVEDDALAIARKTHVSAR